MEASELKWWHVRWGRLGIGFAIVIAGTWTLVGVAGAVEKQLLPSWMTEKLFGHDPSVRVVPGPPTDPSLAQLTGTRVEVYGLSIQTPWNEPGDVKKFRGMTNVNFQKSQFLLLFEAPGQLNALEQLKRDPRTAQVFSDQPMHSNYDLMAASMASTPDQANWWKTRRENARVFMLVSSKSHYLEKLSCSYKVKGPAVRGFQIGDPSQVGDPVLPYHVQLILFDTDDRRIKIDILPSSARPTLTQAQINAMVASIRLIDQK